MLSSITGLFGKKNDTKKNEKLNDKGEVSVRSPEEIGDLEKMILVGPVTFVLVHADWCGHCQTYKPIWKELENVPGRKANMAMIHHDMVENSPTLKKAKIPGYPSVLKVYPNGAIEEYVGDRGKTNGVPNIRDKESMLKQLTEVAPVTSSLIKGNSRNTSGTNNSGTVYAKSVKTNRNLANNAKTAITVQDTLVPSSASSVSIGASNAPKIEPMKGGNLYHALTRALVAAGPAATLLVASQALPQKKGASRRQTRKGKTTKRLRGGKSRKN